MSAAESAMKRRDLEPIIMDTSLALFQERGYQNVSVADICEACDITKPTFYKYALTKGDLLKHFFDRIPDSFDDEWMDVEKQGCWWNCIVAGYTRFLERFMSYGIDFCAQLYIQNIYSPEDTFRVEGDFAQNMIEVISNAQSARQILEDSDPARLADVIMSCMVGYGGQWITSQGKTDLIGDFSRALAALCEANPEVRS